MSSPIFMLSGAILIFVLCAMQSANASKNFLGICVDKKQIVKTKKGEDTCDDKLQNRCNWFCKCKGFPGGGECAIWEKSPAKRCAPIAQPIVWSSKLKDFENFSKN